mgnify:CR=1 FL=1
MASASRITPTALFAGEFDVRLAFPDLPWWPLLSYIYALQTHIAPFRELVYLPGLITHPNFSLLALFTHEEEIWRDDGKGSWRRKGWSIADRALLQVTGAERFAFPGDYLKRRPASLARQVQSGYVYHYAFGMVIGVALMVTWCPPTAARVATPFRLRAETGPL